MATRQTGADHVWFEVDGVRVEPANWHWYPHRWSGAMFTADAEEVQQLLPSPLLHPVRATRDRALVFACGGHIPAVGSQPPLFGFGEVALIAHVTRGAEPAPPLLPMMGARAMTKFGFGLYVLMMVVTNRVAAQLYQTMLGVPASVAALRVEQRLGSERFVCVADDGEIWDLTVRSDGRPTSADEAGAAQSFYAYEDGHVYRVPFGGSCMSRCRYGVRSASLSLGDHPLADRIRRLKLSRSRIAEFNPDRHFWITGAPERVGASRPAASIPQLPEKTCARLVLSPTEGVEFEWDQGIDALGFNPEGDFTRSSLHDRAQ